MKKLLIFTSIVLMVPACSILTELTALTKCEFSFHSAQDPGICGIDINNRQSFTDFSFLDGQVIVRNVLKGTLPFNIRTILFQRSIPLGKHRSNTFTCFSKSKLTCSEIYEYG